jgi:hypothetical protein
MNNLAMLIEKDDINRETHPESVNTLTRDDPQTLPGFQARTPHQPDKASKERIRNHEHAGQWLLPRQIERLHFRI